MRGAVWVGMIIPLILVCSCGKKKCTTPTEPAAYPMRDYFPLNEGDEWTWEVAGDTIAEPFTDGDVNLGEPFTDLNHNGRYDFGEPYEDLNFNGEYDGPYDPWTPGIPYTDRNSNGQYDAPNGKWDPGEFFLDLDSNGICNRATTLTLNGRILYPQNHVMIREGSYTGIFSDGDPGGTWGDEDGFSNDSLGLLWHRHTDPVSSNDLLSTLMPITIANAITQVGDTIINIDTSGVYGWLSVFEAVENLTTPAGTFQDCLKFKSVASGWIGNMAKYNGTSYQWYAKNVGLAKSEGPGEDRHWLLKSAKINGKNYP